MDVNRIFELDELARQDAARYPRKREAYAHVSSQEGKRFTGIVGPRGVGKTVLLKQMAVETSRSVYVSMDTVENGDLFDLVKDLHERNEITTFLLDEIHFQKDYARTLKMLFDFLDLRIVFTSSVSLSLFESAHDLSRRVRLQPLYPFSFREYLLFKKDLSLLPLGLDRIVRKEWGPEHLRHEYLFKAYLKGDLFPFSLEEPDVLSALKNVLAKIIQKDIPMVAEVTLEEVQFMDKLVEFVGRSPSEGISYSSISRNLGITKYKAEQYVGLLEKAFVLNPVFPAGTNVLREPKVLMYLPFRLLYSDYEDSAGYLREDFFAEIMRMKGTPFHYLKSTRGAKTPDFLVPRKGGDIVVEIGGKGKGRSQFKGVEVSEKVILVHPGSVDGLRRPLFLLGCV
jgi:predicted AAA+ superfamily ATPase